MGAITPRQVILGVDKKTDLSMSRGNKPVSSISLWGLLLSLASLGDGLYTPQVKEPFLPQLVFGQYLNTAAEKQNHGLWELPALPQVLPNSSHVSPSFIY